jgi:hypothetical protein
LWLILSGLFNNVNHVILICCLLIKKKKRACLVPRMEVLVELCYVHTVLYEGQEGRAAGSLGHTVVLSRLCGVGSPGHMLPVKLRYEIKTDRHLGLCESKA